MKRLLIGVVVVGLAAMVFFGCDEAGNSTPSDGTLTITIEAGDVDGIKDATLQGAVFEEGYTSDSEYLARRAKDINSDGSVSMTLTDSDGDWTGTGGEAYEVDIWIEFDRDEGPTDGDPRYTTFPVEYTQDGDKTFPSESEYTGPSDYSTE